MNATTRCAIRLSILAGAGCSGGGDSCLNTDPTCNPPPPVYEIFLSQAPPDLGALLIRVEAMGEKIDLSMTSPNGVLTQTAGNAQGTLWRGMILGRPTNFKLGTVTSQVLLGGPPVVTLEEAATTATAGYALIPAGAVRLEVRAVTQ